MTTPTLPADWTLPPFQARVQPWMMACFGPEIAANRIERNHRFLEEALELVQACGSTQSEAHQLVAYVYGRPQGDINQEVGGVMVTLAALCLANEIDMHEGGEVELRRINAPDMIEKIRAKQAKKPRHSPLPVAQVEREEPATFNPLTCQLSASDFPGQKQREEWEAAPAAQEAQLGPMAQKKHQWPSEIPDIIDESSGLAEHYSKDLCEECCSQAYLAGWDDRGAQEAPEPVAQPDRNMTGAEELVRAILFGSPMWPNEWGQDVAAAAFFLTAKGTRATWIPDAGQPAQHKEQE